MMRDRDSRTRVDSQDTIQTVREGFNDFFMSGTGGVHYACQSDKIYSHYIDCPRYTGSIVSTQSSPKRTV